LLVVDLIYFTILEILMVRSSLSNLLVGKLLFSAND